MTSPPHDILSYTFGVLAVVLNGVLLISMYNERRKIFVTRISYLVANLAFADCLNGLFLIILQQPIEEIEFKSDTRTKLALPLSWAAFCASFFTLFLMAAERLVVVTRPMVWATLLTIPRTILGILIVWLLSISCGLAIHFKRYYAQFFLSLLIELSALCFIATHVYILWLLQQREKQRQTANKDPSQTSPCLTTQVTTNEASHIAQRKVTIVVTILLVVLIVTYAPYFVCLQMFTVKNTFDRSLHTKINLLVYHKAFDYTDAFSYVNFFVNPIIYAWRLRMYRQAFFSLFGRNTST